MLEWILALSAGAVTFAATNLDNLVLASVLMVAGLRLRAVGGGLLLATAVVISVCWGLKYAGELTVGPYLHFLGLLPIALGIWRLRQVLKPAPEMDRQMPAGMVSLALLFIVSSLDSVLTLSVLLAETEPPFELPLALGYAGMAAIGVAVIRTWRLPTEARIVRWLDYAVPVLLIAIGALVLADTPID